MCLFLLAFLNAKGCFFLYGVFVSVMVAKGESQSTAFIVG